jgi:hypothetical protein
MMGMFKDCLLDFCPLDVCLKNRRTSLSGYALRMTAFPELYVQLRTAFATLVVFRGLET